MWQLEEVEKIYRYKPARHQDTMVFLTVPYIVPVQNNDENYCFFSNILYYYQGCVPGPLPGLDGAGPDRVRDGAAALHAPPSARVGAYLLY